MIRTIIFSVALMFASTACVLTAEETTTDLNPQTTTAVQLTQDGDLTGTVFALVEGEKQPVEAKLTLSNEEGLVIESIYAKEDGSFSFANVAPGTYNMFGSAGAYNAAQPIAVAPYAATSAVQSYDFDLAPASGGYQVYDAPAASCGGGGGGGFGGGGGGLLGGRRLLKLGLIGGIVAIAVSDSSPDN